MRLGELELQRSKQYLDHIRNSSTTISEANNNNQRDSKKRIFGSGFTARFCSLLANPKVA